jgi:ubiquinone/menaquinone biosynthesis C-methylase UbiE
MSNGSRAFAPALEFRSLDRFFDRFARFTMRDDVFRRRLVVEMALKRGQRVLDVGCGTGSLLLEVKAQQPGAEVVGIDPDPDILSIAREKARGAAVPIALDVGYADHLPYADGSFDHVVSTLAFHHLTSQERRAALREAMRVLRPGGGLHIGDFGQPASFLRPLMVPLASVGGGGAAPTTWPGACRSSSSRPGSGTCGRPLASAPASPSPSACCTRAGRATVRAEPASGTPGAWS